MDCCNNKNQKSSEEMKGGDREMNQKTIMWIVIAILFIVALFLVFRAGAVGSSGTVQAAKSAASSYGGMVGGC